MVEAILNNQKSVTRRVIKFLSNSDSWKTYAEYESKKDGTHPLLDEILIDKAPYKVGEVYYVRETWRIGYLNDDTKEMTIIFKAIQTGCDIETQKCKFSDERYAKFRKFAKKKGWQSPYFMPREAARVFIEMTKIWVEKVQEITDEQAIKEGITKLYDHLDKDEYDKWSNNVCHGKKQDEWGYTNYLWHGLHGNYGLGNTLSNSWDYQCSAYEKATDSYSSLWNLTVPLKDWDRYGWNANPHVWANEFKRLQ
jgi:hypothetical protein